MRSNNNRDDRYPKNSESFQRFIQVLHSRELTANQKYQEIRAILYEDKRFLDEVSHYNEQCADIRGAYEHLKYMISRKGLTPLHFAVMSSDISLIDLIINEKPGLLNAGIMDVELNLILRHHTPLTLAKELGLERVVIFLEHKMNLGSEMSAESQRMPTAHTARVYQPKKQHLQLPEDNPIKSASDVQAFESVTQFVSKNKTINSIDHLFKDQESKRKIAILLKAIKNGDLNNLIFYDGNAQLYSLCLLKENKINTDEYLTVNMCLLGILQHSNDLTNRHSGGSSQINFEFKLVSMDDHGVKEAFLSNLEKYSQQKDHALQNKFPPVTIEALKSTLSELSSLGKTVIELTFNAKSVGSANAEFMFQVASTGVICGSAVTNNDIEWDGTYRVLIPSAQVINHMLSLANPNRSVNMLPVFGSISLLTLFNLHQRGVHPVSIYLSHIKSNPQKVHGVAPGPLPILLHDIFHVVSGNRFSKNEYDFLYSYLLPKYSQYLDIPIEKIKLAESRFECPGHIQDVHDAIDLSFSSNDINTIISRLLFLTSSSTIPSDVRQGCTNLIGCIRNDAERIKERFHIDIDEILNNHTSNNQLLRT